MDPWPLGDWPSWMVFHHSHQKYWEDLRKDISTIIQKYLNKYIGVLKFKQFSIDTQIITAYKMNNNNTVFTEQIA